ncbi:HNH endonuclease signature motif containing protein, partial [Occultella aeris]|uniref:HNH endonuclease signature motif containing protein n=1 Tax=Occultella aeris TaxID=2761496 RepID=UPI0018D3DFDE
MPWVDAPDGSDEPGDPSGGRTSADNLSPLCGRDHNLKTHGDFEVEQTEPGVFEWTTPAGLRYRRERDETTTFLGHI